MATLSRIAYCNSRLAILFVVTGAWFVPYCRSQNDTQPTGVDSEAALSYCGAPVLNVSWYQAPPYFYRGRTTANGSELHGAVYETLVAMARNCCGSDVTLNMSAEKRSARALERTGADTHFSVPVIRGLMFLGMDNKLPNTTFLPILQSPGSVLLVKAVSSSDIILRSLAGTWSLAVLALAATGIAGIIVWVLDCHCNPENFPRSFFRGSWEGTWWAFVTMTTVGYGDRVPRSVPARVLAFLWMVTGIIIMATFTASLITALSKQNNSVDHLDGMKVGVLDGSEEEMDAYGQGAVISVFHTFKAMENDLDTGAIDGILIDNLFAIYESDRIRHLGLVVAKSDRREAVHGIIVRNLDAESILCFTDYAIKHRSYLFEYMAFGGALSKKSSAATNVTSQIIGGVYTPVVAAAAVWAVLFLAGAVYEVAYRRTREQRRDATSHDGPSTRLGTPTEDLASGSISAKDVDKPTPAEPNILHNL